MELYRENVVVSADHFTFNDSDPANIYLMRQNENTLVMFVKEIEAGRFMHSLISIDLFNETPADGCFLLKNYGGYQGLANHLERKGVVEIIRPIEISDGNIYEVKLLGDIPIVP